MQNTYRYSAFGEETIFGSTLNPWRFASKRVDLESGFSYFGQLTIKEKFDLQMSSRPTRNITLLIDIDLSYSSSVTFLSTVYV